MNSYEFKEIFVFKDFEVENGLLGLERILLIDAPRVFTHIMKKAIQSIREIWRFQCMIYLDNLLRSKSIERNHSPDYPIWDGLLIW
jgi:hypothetical protein